MSRTVLTASILVLCPTLALAQGDVPVAEAQQDPVAAHDELMKAFTKAVQEWRQEALKQVAEARKNGKPMPAIAMSPPTRKYIDQARELAKQYAGEDTALQFHGFVLKYANVQDGGDREAVTMTVRTLTLDHSASEKIGELLPFLQGAAQVCSDDVIDLFGEVIEANPSDAAKANALLGRGTMRLQAGGTDEERKAAQADLERVASVTQDEKLIAQAESTLFEIKHLQVGCEAPDIVAKDVDGVEFKLSDYRGKVVLLDFWGFW